MSYVFDLATLDQVATAQASRFAQALPYPHAVIDDFLQPACALELARVFPGPDDAMVWDLYSAQGYEMKRASAHEERFPALLRQAVHDLNSGPFIGFLERLTGIEHLLPDPHLVGGGLHLTRRGDHLGIHADFNWHEAMQAHRRLNVLVYLNPPQWQPEYGGALELWATDASHRVRTIEPHFNRAVIFTTRSDTFHGHPLPWAAPAGVYRQSLAMYYYTTTRPTEELREAHSTLYKGYHV